MKSLKSETTKSAMAGITLVELAVSMAITSVLAIGVAAFLNQQNHNINDMRHSMRMKIIAKDLEYAASLPQAIYTSAVHSQEPGNQELLACLAAPNAPGSGGKPLTTSTCTATDPSNQREFALILPVNISLPPSEFKKLLEKQTVAGTDSFPVHYSLDGRRHCAKRNEPGGQGKCQLEARAFFWATCAPDLASIQTTITSGSNLPSTASSCPEAETINIRVQVRHAFNPANNITTRQLPAVPRDEVFFDKGSHTTHGAISTPVRLVPMNLSLGLTCPKNETVTGVRDGDAVCECLFPFEVVTSGATSSCEAKNEICQPWERYRGTNNKGEIICKPVKCDPISTSLNASCGNGGWVERIELTRPSGLSHAENPVCMAEACRFGPKGGGCDSEVTCYGKTRCCYETK